MDKFDSKNEEILSLVSGGRFTDEASGWVQRNLDALLIQRPECRDNLLFGLFALDVSQETYDLDYLKNHLQNAGYNLSGLR